MSTSLSKEDRLAISKRLIEMDIDPTEADLNSWAHLAHEDSPNASTSSQGEPDETWEEIKAAGKGFLSGVVDFFEEALAEDDEESEGDHHARSSASTSRGTGPVQPVRSGRPSPIESGSVFTEDGEEMDEEEKAVFGAFLLMGLALVYFLSPIDLIPDVALGIGQVDDLGVAGLAGANLVRAFMSENMGFFEAAERAIKWMIALVVVGVIGVVVILSFLLSKAS